MWEKREIENYLCTKKTLIAYASEYVAKGEESPLFALQEREQRRRAMEDAILKISDELEKSGKNSPWGDKIKASDEFLEPVFECYRENCNMSRMTLQKNQFHELVNYIPDDEIDDEIKEKLDAIVRVAKSASGQGLPN